MATPVARTTSGDTPSITFGHRGYEAFEELLSTSHPSRYWTDEDEEDEEDEGMEDNGGEGETEEEVEELPLGGGGDPSALFQLDWQRSRTSLDEAMEELAAARAMQEEQARVESALGGAMMLPATEGDAPAVLVNQVAALQSRIKELQTQLISGALDGTLGGLGGGAAAVASLAEAQGSLQAASALLLAGDESAQLDFDRWDAFINTHPEKIAKDEEAAREWEEREASANTEALRVMRTFVPSGMTRMAQDALLALGLSSTLVRRFKKLPVLGFVRMAASNLSTIHIADLQGKFSFHGLDLTEMRSLYVVLGPVTFATDPSGEKAEWKRNVGVKLKDLVRRRHAAAAAQGGEGRGGEGGERGGRGGSGGGLRPAEERAKCYRDFAKEREAAGHGIAEGGGCLTQTRGQREGARTRRLRWSSVARSTRQRNR